MKRDGTRQYIRGFLLDLGYKEDSRLFKLESAKGLAETFVKGTGWSSADVSGVRMFEGRGSVSL